jgi:hypothetical protein
VTTYESGPHPQARGSEDGILVIHCSDPRYQPHFQEFVRNRLGLVQYGLIAIPGGVQTLTLVEYLPKFAWSGWRWMKFMSNLMRPRRIILIGHDDCRWYIENRFADDPAHARTRLIEDLRRVRVALVERFDRARVESYYATLKDDRAVFDMVT